MNITPQTERRFSVLLTKDLDGSGGAWWLAQCLDHDIVAQARSVGDALYELTRMLVGRIAVAEQLGMADPFAGVPPASPECWEEYVKGEALASRVDPTFAVTAGPHPRSIQPVLQARVV